MILRYSRFLVVSSVSFLILVGFMVLLSHSMVDEPRTWLSPLVSKQIISLGIGLVALFVAVKIPINILWKYAVHSYLFAIGLLALTFLMGTTAGGASRWLSFGGFTFQPSEVAKLVVVVFTSYYLTRFKHCFGHIRPLVLYMFSLGIVALLVLMSPDLGSAFAITLIALVMLWISEVPKVYLLSFGLSLLPAVFYASLSQGYRLNRLMAFLDPWNDPWGNGYQNIQSYVSFAIGGVLGKGFTNSYQKFFYLPASHTDFAFSIIGEEFGLIGTCLVLVAYAVIFFTGMALAIKFEDRFHAFLVAGLTLLICIPAFINICVVIGLLPITGIPLTFVSYGGSSLVVSLFSVGLILNLEKKNRATVF